MVSLKRLLLALALCIKVQGKPAPSVTCTTKFGTVSVKYPVTKTSIKTQTITRTKKVYCPHDKTVTPKPKTVTITATKVKPTTITAGPETKTATTTVSEISTIVETNLASATEYTTTTLYTTSTSTTTVAAPADFTPITYNPDYVAKREVSSRLNPRKSSKNNNGAVKISYEKGKYNPVTYPRQYPQRVNCIRKVIKTATKTITTRVPGHTITLAPKTKTKSTTITQFTTETQYLPDVSETVTETTSINITSTEDVVTTTTLTATSTIETVVPTTIYEACSSDNILTSANGGNRVNEFGTDGGSRLEYIGSGYSAYTCCVACHTVKASNCRGLLHYW
ncbi:hypothetical protein G7Z17_g5363 [Cylindrodendrum hubeiense]|uniref:Uncharacterized protein n=1 Tax=Cylindrodendrum hubeiense TaxID=595255 RepID=A0A9P5H932_9HYPO|nr:hypothetical protein G7Z17_g5363 [Cylindrodendrum hubeiense]